MLDRDRLKAALVAGIDRLSYAEILRDVGLFKVVILPQIAQSSKIHKITLIVLIDTIDFIIFRWYITIIVPISTKYSENRRNFYVLYALWKADPG